MRRLKACQNRVKGYLRKTDRPMRSIGDNVFSLLGFQITEFPDFSSKRGPKSVFNVSTSPRNDAITQVSGTMVAFGLVIHRSIAPSPGLFKWVISEPTTGQSVAWGSTKQNALEDLSMRVAFYGGKSTFEQVLNDAVTRAKNSRNNHHG